MVRRIYTAFRMTAFCAGRYLQVGFSKPRESEICLPADIWPIIVSCARVEGLSVSQIIAYQSKLRASLGHQPRTRELRDLLISTLCCMLASI